MKSIARYSMMILAVVLAALWGGWNDGWYLMTGLVAVGFPLAGLVIWKSFRIRRPREAEAFDEGETNAGVEAEFAPDVGSTSDAETTTEDTAPALRESLVVGAVQGVPLGVALSVYLMVVFALSQQVPWIYDRYYDADRTTLEAKLSTLEQAANHGQAVATIKDRLSRKTGCVWRKMLLERLYTDLVQQARHLAAAERLPLLVEARQIAKENRLDESAARALLEEATRETNLATRIDELRAQQDWAAVVDVLKSELLRDDESIETARMLYDALCTAAVHATSPDQQAEWYSQAVDLAGRYRLSADRAQAALAQIESALGNQTQQERQLAQLSRESTETRRQLIEEMCRGAEELTNPDARLAVLKRVTALADEHGLEIPSVQHQLAELEATIARQRQLIEGIGELLEDRKLAEAIKLLSSAVRTTDCRDWIKPLDTELLDCLRQWCHAADSAELDTRRERLNQAMTIAMECGMDVPELKYRLAVAEAELTDRERIRARIAELTRQGRFTDLVAYLKVRIGERAESASPMPYDRELYKALVGAALESGDLNERCALLQEALATASKYGLQESKSAEEHLADTESRLQEKAEEERRRTAPIELPKGAKAGIARVSTEELPFVTLDVFAEVDGAPINGLEAKDFKVTIDGRPAPFLVQPVSIDQAPRFFAIVVDISGSASPALRTLKSGVNQLTSQLAKTGAQMKLIPFNAEVNTEIPWTGDATVISKAVLELNAEGGTALYRALLAAVEGLAGRPRPGKRHILVFTDGKNEDDAGEILLDEVLQQCREKGIAVSAIGLRTQELDPEILQRLTAETGGQYLEAANVAELATRFLQASQSFRRDRYRLVANIGHSSGRTNQQERAYSVAIGGRNAVLVNGSIPSFVRMVARTPNDAVPAVDLDLPRNP